ncbi:hypothetical protein CK203_077047 [Vitis vinifera]|uniref:Uncharacterized protein n=1 Tax=Vitis vinifera TaxID=29760 RepID=A0A438DIT1_VITVI|nr:hypothetical protein CK203_077047 [Vitis vinifera]
MFLQCDEDIISNAVPKHSVSNQSNREVVQGNNNISKNHPFPHGSLGRLPRGGRNCCMDLQHHIVTSIGKCYITQGAKEGEDSSVVVKAVHVYCTSGEKAIDIFEGIQVKWDMVYTKKQSNEGIDYEPRSIELSFPKKNMKKILSSNLLYVVERSEAFIEENKVLKLYSYCGSAVSIATQEFRRLLVTARNQSILEIEDIDSSSELQGQQAEEHNLNDSQLTPTAIAEELMKSEEADSALGKLVPQKVKDSTK